MKLGRRFNRGFSLTCSRLRAKFSRFLFPSRPLQVSLFSRSATIHVVQSVIQIHHTGQWKRLRRRSPWGNGSSMSNGHPTSLAPGKFDGSRRRQSVGLRRLLQGVACLEPRTCCSRGDTERQVARWILLPLAAQIQTKPWS